MNRWLLQLSRDLIPERLKVPLRGLRFALAQTNFHPYVIDKDLDGTRFRFLIGDSIGRQWYDNESRSGMTPEQAFMRDRMIRPGDVIIDCGAHHGMETIPFALWAGSKGRVLAFEPIEENFQILTANVALNGLQNVTCFQYAISSRVGETRMTRESNARETRGANLGVRVRTTRLDEFTRYQPNVLKIDVEGSEIQALRGAREILALRPRIAIEVHTEALEKNGSNVDELFQLVGRDSYDWWLQAANNEEPLPFRPGGSITKRVLLFALPRSPL
jgi:FkbM family methyltransferase